MDSVRLLWRKVTGSNANPENIDNNRTNVVPVDMSLTQNVTTCNTVQFSTASDTVSTVASAVEMSAGWVPSGLTVTSANAGGVSSGLTVTSLAVPRISAQAGSAGVDRQLGQVLSSVSLGQNNAADLQNGQNYRFLRLEDGQLYGRVSNGMNNEPVQMLQSTNSGQQANELVRTSSASQTYEPRNVQMQGTVHSPPPTNEFLPGTYSTPIEQERAQGDVHYAQRIGRQANDPHSSGNDPDAIGMTARQHSGLVVRAASNHAENSNGFQPAPHTAGLFPQNNTREFLRYGDIAQENIPVFGSQGNSDSHSMLEQTQPSSYTTARGSNFQPSHKEYNYPAYSINSIPHVRPHILPLNSHSSYRTANSVPHSPGDNSHGMYLPDHREYPRVDGPIVDHRPQRIDSREFVYNIDNNVNILHSASVTANVPHHIADCSTTQSYYSAIEHPLSSKYAAHSQTNRINFAQPETAKQGNSQSPHDSCYVTSSITARKAMFPDRYDGESDWEEYIRHFEDIATWNGWNASERATQLGLHLTGMARSVKTDLPIHITSDYDQLVQSLGKYFSSEGKEATFQAEFRLRKRDSNEKLSNFAHDLTRLCKKAFPKMDRGSREQFVLERFKLGLDSALRRHIQFQHPESLETAIYAGLEFEAMEGDRESDRHRKPIASIQTVATEPPQNHEPASTNTNDLLVKMMEQNMNMNQKMMENMSNMIEKMQQKQRPRLNPANITCFHCNQKGHFRSNCPQLQAQIDNPQQISAAHDSSAPGNA